MVCEQYQLFDASVKFLFLCEAMPYLSKASAKLFTKTYLYSYEEAQELLLL